MKKSVAILGSTGSIGKNTLKVVRGNPERFRVVALSAGRNIEVFKSQIKEFNPSFVSLLEEKSADELKRWLKRCGLGKIEVGFGEKGVSAAATHKGADMVVSAIVGAAGFVPTLAAIKAGKDVALANKETLVIGGHLVMKEVKKRGVRLLPIDSEHSAVFQALEGHRIDDVKRIILTASGGPFLNVSYGKLKRVTPNEALRHPTWNMGRRITVDCATLMNKGFEVIEAHWLFGIKPEKIATLIHPQSIVHSLVEYIDGSVIAEMGSSDMKLPIAYALTYPERIKTAAKPFSLIGKKLEFTEPDVKRFPCLTLAYEALKSGDSYPCALNAADEVTVDMFLKGMIKFTDIPRIIDMVLQRHCPRHVSSTDVLLDVDRKVRIMTLELIKKCRATL